MKRTEISDAELRLAFQGFMDRFKAQTSLQGDALDTYVQQAVAAFEANLHRDTGTIEGNRAFLLLRSTSHYVSYPGDNQVNLELEPDIGDSALGEALETVIRASTRMTLEFLTGAVPRVERDEGMSRYKALVEGLCRRHAYKTKRAMFKSTKLVHVDCDRSVGDIELHPTTRFAVDGFRGLDASQSVHVPAQASAEEIGRALRAALARCTDEYGK